MKLKILVTRRRRHRPRSHQRSRRRPQEPSPNLAATASTIHEKRIGGVAIVARRHAAARGHPRRRARLRRRSPRRGRRQRVQFPPPRQAPRGRPAATPRGARRIRQPAPRLRLQGTRRQQPAAPGDHRRRRHPLRARTARRPLLRPAARMEQGQPAKPGTPCATPATKSSAWRASPSSSPRKRRKKLTSVDKANVLEVSQLWRATVT